MDRMEEYKQAAVTLATAICRDAIWLKDQCTWIGSSSEDYYGMPKAYAKALSSSFYDGTAGIAFFLTALHQVHKDAIMEQTAHGALQQIINAELSEKQPDILYGKLGFYTGWPGCAYVLQMAGEVFGKKQYIDAAKTLINQCIKLPQDSWSLDVIDGAAGAIPALLAFYKKHPTDKLKDFVIGLGEYLIAKADKNNMGVSWDTMAEKSNNLTGYGHGAAGFAHAFTELFAFTGDKKYVKIVKDIAAYEDAHFNKEQQNWPDFRRFPNAQPIPQNAAQEVCSLAWCHGAPGIGLSRLRAYEITKEEIFKKDAMMAVQTTIQGNAIEVMANYSMCHGLFGNAELLLYAAKVFNRTDYRQLAEQSADSCIASFLNKRLPIPNGLQTPAETPDFMLGSSGIGYFFLRLYDSEKFPCMLLIAP